MTPLLLLALLGACADDTVNVENTPVDTSDRVDTEGPVIEHDPITTAQPYGQPVQIEATVYDEKSEVFVVEVYYKQETSTDWMSAGLVAQDGDLYVGAIPAEDVGSAGMHYYLYAVDTQQNESYLPDEGASNPWHFRVTSD